MAALSAIVMPKWGMEMTEGEIAEWHVAVGDLVSAGDDLVEVETAKLVNTVAASATGTVVRLCAQVGEILPVGSALAVVADGETSDAEVDAFLAGAAVGEGSSAAIAEVPPEGGPAAPAPGATAPPTGRSPGVGGAADEAAVPATAVARRLARDNNLSLSSVTPTGRHGRVTLRDLRAAAEAAGTELQLPAGRDFASPPLPEDGAVKATPVARRLAAQLGINLHECRPSGRHARVSKADVEAVAARRGVANGSTAPPAAMSAAAPESSGLSAMRRTIARRVHRAKQEAPHFRVNIDIEVSAALALRARLNERSGDARISLNDILLKACACALTRNPALNARFDGEVLERYTQCHIASAVAVEGGVMMPVVRGVEGKGLLAIAGAMRDLAARAREGRLASDELEGGTFSISNLGMYGIGSFDAIINQPQVAILAVGAAEERPLARDGELRVGRMMSLSVASDHRVVDGADAARFLADLKGFMEEPASMLG
jgi:pyruvate dehydrogenase E2 component (dihydrolipoamide acetyltransferase)